MPENTERRFAQMMRRPTMHDREPDFIRLSLEDATAYFLEYTNRREDPGAEADSVICAIAALYINMEGWENMKKAKDGEYEREMEATIPPMLKARLDTWRLMRGLR